MQVRIRPIRPSRWVAQQPVPQHRVFFLSPRWLWTILAVVLVVTHVTSIPQSHAQHSSSSHEPSYETAATDEPQLAHAVDSWEGSAPGIAYSQFNHRLAGLCLLLIGLSELDSVFRRPSPLWTRLVLSFAFGVVGVFLLVWSDHDAWPIGSMSFTQTFFGQEHEILQHKFYGILATTVALCEFLRRIGWVAHPAWAVPLPFFAVIGGLMLFVHSHGVHPAAQQIEVHHALMGALAVSAGASKAVAAWVTSLSSGSVRRLEVAWVGHIFLIGVQLLVYFE